MDLPQIDSEIQKSDALAALFRRMDKLGWPKYEDDSRTLHGPGSRISGRGKGDLPKCLSLQLTV